MRHSERPFGPACVSTCVAGRARGGRRVRGGRPRGGWTPLGHLSAAWAPTCFSHAPLIFFSSFLLGAFHGAFLTPLLCWWCCGAGGLRGVGRLGRVREQPRVHARPLRRGKGRTNQSACYAILRQGCRGVRRAECPPSSFSKEVAHSEKRHSGFRLWSTVISHPAVLGCAPVLHTWRSRATTST